MSVLNNLLDLWHKDRWSLDIQQCRVLIDYLEWEVELKQKQIDKAIHEIADLEQENSDFADCWLHKDKLRELFKEVEISDYNSCVEFVLAVKHLLKWEE